jgi:hypothetical protein
VQLLTNLFPDIGLERKKFSKLSSKRTINNIITTLIYLLVSAWNKEQRRKIADDFALRMGINQIAPADWRKLPKDLILCDKVLYRCLNFLTKVFKI